MPVTLGVRSSPQPTENASLWRCAVYIARRALKRRGASPDEVNALVPRLLSDLLQIASVLTNHGFEQEEIYSKAHDFEDAQIAAAARSLAGQQVCVVTEDDDFDTLVEVPKKTPAEALAWLCGEPDHRPQQQPLPFIDLSAQQTRIRPQLERHIEAVLRHGQYIMGPEVGELEEKLADYVGVKHCIGVASGTDALLIALMAFGVGPGDEVITTPFTFIATGEVISLLGAIPVFMDIDPRTYNIDPARIEAVITPQTRALMPLCVRIVATSQKS